MDEVKVLLDHRLSGCNICGLLQQGRHPLCEGTQVANETTDKETKNINRSSREHVFLRFLSLRDVHSQLPVDHPSTLAEEKIEKDLVVAMMRKNKQIHSRLKVITFSSNCKRKYQQLNVQLSCVKLLTFTYFRLLHSLHQIFSTIF